MRALDRLSLIARSMDDAEDLDPLGRGSIVDQVTANNVATHFAVAGLHDLAHLGMCGKQCKDTMDIADPT